MIIPIFSNIIVMTFYTVLNIGIIIVSPLNPLFPFFLHHHCLQILYTTNFLRENVFYILFHSFFLNKCMTTSISVYIHVVQCRSN